jgi:hypothetical protein
VEKKIWTNLQKIVELSTQKIVKLSKIWGWGPISRIRKKPILNPGGTGSGSSTLTNIAE